MLALGLSLALHSVIRATADAPVRVHTDSSLSGTSRASAERETEGETPRDRSPPPRFPPPANGALGLLWFGANATGPDGGAQLDFVKRHTLAGYGWQ